MVVEWIQSLLVLEDRDTRLAQVTRQLEDAPRQIAADEAQIISLEASVKSAEAELKVQEAKRRGLETEVEGIEEAIRRYKTQQLQVKKNEEYAALDHEIANAQQKISDLEDSQLELIEAIETGQTQLDALEHSVEEQIATLRYHISQLHDAHAAAQVALEDAKQAVVKAESKVDARILPQYRYVRSQVKRPPVIVPIEDSRCQGCHLKVSGEVESAARKGSEFTRCDSCGRIVYFDR